MEKTIFEQIAEEIRQAEKGNYYTAAWRNNYFDAIKEEHGIDLFSAFQGRIPPYFRQEPDVLIVWCQMQANQFRSIVALNEKLKAIRGAK